MTSRSTIGDVISREDGNRDPGRRVQLQAAVSAANVGSLAQTRMLMSMRKVAGMPMWRSEELANNSAHESILWGLSSESHDYHVDAAWEQHQRRMERGGRISVMRGPSVFKDEMYRETRDIAEQACLVIQVDTNLSICSSLGNVFSV